MKLLYDFLPIVLFFAAYWLAGIFVATAAAVAAAAVQVGASLARRRGVEPLHLISAGLIVAFGGATLVLHDKGFIMWKPTLVYALFAGVFAASQVYGRRPVIQRLLGEHLRMPAPSWRRLTWAWVGFFLVCGTANAGLVEYYGAAEAQLRAAAPAAPEAAYQELACRDDFVADARRACGEAATREALWVQFKLFGLLVLTVAFIVGQSLWLARRAVAVERGATDGDERCSTQS